MESGTAVMEKAWLENELPTVVVDELCFSSLLQGSYLFIYLFGLIWLSPICWEWRCQGLLHSANLHAKWGAIA